MTVHDVRITVVVENTAHGAGMLAEHGLAWLIETEGARLLFDTGQGGALANNLRKLGRSLGEIDTVVLSHGHYDHAGGLADVLHGNRPATVVLHPDALQGKYAKNSDGTVRNVGMPNRCARALQQSEVSLRTIDGPTRIVDGIEATGPIRRTNDFEQPSPKFFTDKDASSPDQLADDLALYFDAEGGTVVLLGCAHTGVINTLSHVSELTDHRPIQAVLGGMHLVDASPQRIARTLGALKKWNLKLLAPAHCTGTAATLAIWNAFPQITAECHVRSQFVFRAVY